MVSDGNTYLKFNPLNSVKIDFGAYIKEMQNKDEAHRINGIPDYAFPLDLNSFFLFYQQKSSCSC